VGAVHRFDFWRYALVLSKKSKTKDNKLSAACPSPFLLLFKISGSREVSHRAYSVAPLRSSQGTGITMSNLPAQCLRVRPVIAQHHRHWDPSIPNVGTIILTFASYPFSAINFTSYFVLIVLLHIGWAASTTPHSTASDPAEEEALLCLEQGTQKLEEGDVEGAKILYQRSVDIKRNASSLFNLGVTHYHLSSYSFRIRWSLFVTQPHEKRSLTKLSILGQLPLSSNHLAQMHIPVRLVPHPSSEPSLLTHLLLCVQT